MNKKIYNKIFYILSKDLSLLQEHNYTGEPALYYDVFPISILKITQISKNFQKDCFRHAFLFAVKGIVFLLKYRTFCSDEEQKFICKYKKYIDIYTLDMLSKNLSGKYRQEVEAFIFLQTVIASKNKESLIFDELRKNIREFD